MHYIINNVLFRILEESAPDFDYGNFINLHVEKDKIVVQCRNGGNTIRCDCTDEELCIGCIQLHKIPHHPLYLKSKTGSNRNNLNYFSISEKYKKLITYLMEVLKKGKLCKISKMEKLILPNSLIWEDITNALTEMRVNPDPISRHNYDNKVIDQKIKEFEEKANFESQIRRLKEDIMARRIQRWWRNYWYDAKDENGISRFCKYATKDFIFGEKTDYQ